MQQDYSNIKEGLTGYVYIGTFVFILLAVLFVLFLSISLIRRRRMQREAQELQFQFQQELLRSQLEIQEQTLKTISQEIHDNIGQVLSLAKINIATMPVDENNTALQEKVQTSKQLVSKAISDLRSLSHSLDTDYVKEMGLQRAIEYELEMIKKTGTMETYLHIEGSPARLDKQKELIIFRIVQESLNNIMKHAEAQKIHVEIQYGSIINLQISDDGMGVDLSPLNRDDSRFGLGIKNMHNRAKLIGADFSMQSTLGKGTTVKIVLPVETRQDENKQ